MARRCLAARVLEVAPGARHSVRARLDLEVVTVPASPGRAARPPCCKVIGAFTMTLLYSCRISYDSARVEPRAEDLSISKRVGNKARAPWSSDRFVLTALPGCPAQFGTVSYSSSLAPHAASSS